MRVPTLWWLHFQVPSIRWVLATKDYSAILETKMEPLVGHGMNSGHTASEDPYGMDQTNHLCLRWLRGLHRTILFVLSWPQFLHTSIVELLEPTGELGHGAVEATMGAAEWSGSST